jgi:hypothetical protein
LIFIKRVTAYLLANLEVFFYLPISFITKKLLLQKAGTAMASCHELIAIKKS